MTQPGHSTDIYTSRYLSQALNTTFAPNENRPGDGSYTCEQVNLGAASGTFNVAAPCSGRLERAVVQSQTTTDGTNTITLALTNESNSAASMVPSALYDDDPVITTNVETVLTLSTTSTNLDVTRGDNLELAYTEGGTIAGGVVTLYFSNN